MSPFPGVFRERDYALYFTGQALSFTGTWIQSTTINWLLYRLTDSPLSLGSLSAATNLPLLILLPFGGSVVDRFNRRRFLLCLQTLFMIHGIILGLLAYLDCLSLGILVLMGCVQSLLNAFDGPARQAFVPMTLTDIKHMPAAISFNSVMVNTTRMVGPPLAGWILAGGGPAPCFALNAFSYLCMLMALVLIRLTPSTCLQKKFRAFGVVENFRFIAGFPLLRFLFLSYTSVAVGTMSVYVLLPVWAGEILHTGPQGLGFLMGGIGAGALVGAAIIGLQRKPERLFSLFQTAAPFLGIGLLFLWTAQGRTMALVVTVMLGLAYIGQSIAANTLIQMNIDNERRAGIMAFFLLIAYGSVPVGNLLGGGLANYLGLREAAMTAGIVILAFSAFMWRSGAKIRPA